MLFHSPRVIFYSHDTFGLGHLRRNLAIIEKLLNKHLTTKPLLITGSPLQNTWPFPEGLEVLPLPPVVKVGEEKYEARNTAVRFEMIKEERENLIVNAIKKFNPDLFLVDHAPTGMKGELLKAFDYLKKYCPDTTIALGLRDILDNGLAVRKLWKEQGVYDVLENIYDIIWIYGCKEVYDVFHEYQMPESLKPKIQYTGYVVRTDHMPLKSSVVQRESSPIKDTPFKILVTAGGGEDGFFIFDSFLKVIKKMEDENIFCTLVLGPLMSAQNRIKLEEEAVRLDMKHVQFLSSTTELTELIEKNNLIIAMGGYNTTAEILVSGKPAILIPRAKPREEQRIRTRIFGQMGLVWDIQPEEPIEMRLQEIIKAALEGKKPSRKGSVPLNVNGAQWVAREIKGVLRNKTNLIPV